MKLIKRAYLLLAAVLVCLSIISMSCKKFLNLQPISQSSVDEFFTTADDFEAAVNGMYSGVAALLVGDHFAYYNLLTDLRSDNCTEFELGGGGDGQKRAIDRFEEDPSNETVTAFWKDSYKVIQRANSVLGHLDGAPLSQEKMNQYRGESKVLRAWSYYNLVRFYGDVPLALNSKIDLNQSYEQGRNSVDEVYKQIIDDLAEASTLLPLFYSNKNDVGRVTKGVAQTLLGSVYLTLKKYQDAAAQFQSVIDSKQYELLPVYEDLYSAGMQGNKESIWEILFKSGTAGLGSQMPNWYAPSGSGSALVASGGTFGFCQPTTDLRDDFEAGDIRRLAIADGYTDKNGVYQEAKYAKYYVARESGSGKDDSGSDWYVLRYANILLWCAEALNEANQGPDVKSYEYLNAVRDRAGLSPLTGLDYESFKTAVYHEQRVEYPFEGHRWFDLLRTDRALSVMNSKVSSISDLTSVGLINPIQKFQLLYPVPEIVISVSKNITQNPGY